MKSKNIRAGSVASLLVATGACLPAVADDSVARQWNELLLSSIRIDTPRPTVHARNLFHTSAAMYNAWAAYDGSAEQYVVNVQGSAGDVEAARNEAISFAAYRVISNRFAASPNHVAIQANLDAKMAELGYDINNTSTHGGSAAAIGNKIAKRMVNFGLQDGSNQAGNYADTTGYVPVNAPLDVSLPGTTMVDPNAWQPLKINGNTQKFLTPHWKDVKTFAAARPDSSSPYYDQGPLPTLGGPMDDRFKDEANEVIRYSGFLDPTDGVMMDAGPGSRGNSSLGTNDGTGHLINPSTGMPYAPNMVKQGDWGRVLAEFWADGPNSETPPGHWNSIANEVSDNPLLQKKIGGVGPVVSDLEWDIKTYFALNGAVHDAAITAWSHKENYDGVRPISMIRYMGGLGQSSDPMLPSYNASGLKLESGVVELIDSSTTAPGQRHEHLAGNEGKIAIFAWAGHPDDPDTEFGGCSWILAEEWMPYQAETFVTPAFPGYTSGHSTFSRASAEILALLTGSEYFPGGLGEFTMPADSLNFEFGPSEDITLQWATFYDAADEAGLSRLYGGIHVAADDFNGRISGSLAGIGAWQQAMGYFDGTLPAPGTGVLLGLGGLLAARRRR